MTTIKITPQEIEVSGHSGYAEIGKDIVCAAISTLTQATYNYLRKTDNLVVLQDSEGYYLIELLKLNYYGSEIIGSYIEMVEDLASQYPLYLKIEKGRTKWKNWIN